MALRFLSRHNTVFTKVAKRLLTVEITSQQEFDEKVLKSKLPVVVDFHASWCGPCKQLTPILDKVMKEYDGKVNLAKIDVDEFQDLAIDYDVMSVPTVLGLKNGELVGQFVGMKPENDIHDLVKKLLKD